MGGEKILIIDDRRENLLFLADSVLRPEGYEVITALDGKQGLDKALAEKPDLIITDLKMPRMSGLELMAALRKTSANTAVILTTFYGSEQAAIEAFRLGAKDYVIKPYEVKDMLESVERALIEQRLRRETHDLQEGAQVRHLLEDRVRQLHSLCGIGKALLAIHEPDEAACVAVEAAIHLTSAACGQLFLQNPETGQLEVRAVRGPSDARANSVRQPGTDRTTQQAFESGKLVVAERSTARQGKIPRLAVPVRTAQAIVGVLGIDAKPAYVFTENDRYLMNMLAGFVAVAMDNAHLYEQLHQRSAGAEPSAPSHQEPPDQVVSGAVGDCADEAERLSRELRNLAAAAQVLAAKLQVTGGMR